MRIRRCTYLWLEPRESAHLDLGLLLSGGTGVVTTLGWWAHAPQLDAPVLVNAEALALLGELSPSQWSPLHALRSAHDAKLIRSLLGAGLLIGSTKPWQVQRERDELLAAQHWDGLAGQWHAASRW